MKTVRLSDANVEFGKYLKSNQSSNATIVAYTKDVEQLISFLQELQKHHVHEVKKEDIEAFLTKMGGAGYTPKSVSRKLNSTRTFYRFLKINEYITDDPSILVAHPQYHLAPPRILTPTEYRALRDAAQEDSRMYAIIELLLQTGIRIGELASLKMKHVKKDSLRIQAVEKHEERTVPLNLRAREALRRYFEVRPKIEVGPVFVTKSGKPFLIRNIRTAIDRYFKIAEIKNAKINDLRHTFVAYHLHHGVSLVLLSKLLGHKRLSTTERYLDFVPERGKETAVLSEL
ncbi:MAG: tyrosine-type recombinase/integrase [Candidatus Levybacteria bacterium]|nr:tyrosine-type recombinase/integrase [Candidatus Levybacteria bacterium]